MDPKQEIKGVKNIHYIWELNKYKVVNQEGLGGRIILILPNREKIYYALKYEFQPTNNKKE